MAISSDWFVGAWRNFPGSTFTVGGNSKTVPAGDYYLWHSTPSISLLSQIQTLVQEEVPSAAVTLTRSGKVKFSASGAINLAWGSDTTMRDRLGHTEDFNTTEKVGANHTRYLWRSGTTHSPRQGPLGVVGRLTGDRVYARAPGVVSSVEHNTWYENEIELGFILASRYKTSSAANGEFDRWAQDVYRLGYRFRLYREVTEDETSTDADLSTPENLGPYAKADDDPAIPFARVPGLERADIANSVVLRVRTLPELS